MSTTNLQQQDQEDYDDELEETIKRDLLEIDDNSPMELQIEDSSLALQTVMESKSPNVMKISKSDVEKQT